MILATENATNRDNHSRLILGHIVIAFQKGLGLFNGSVRHFRNFHDPEESKLKIPQMGWNQVGQTQGHPLWHGIEDQSHFYLVHSYCANTNPDANLGMVVGHADYGHQFIAAAAAPMVFATQFHPEKSSKAGSKILENFLKL